MDKSTWRRPVRQLKLMLMNLPTKSHKLRRLNPLLKKLKPPRLPLLKLQLLRPQLQKLLQPRSAASGSFLCLFHRDS